MAKLLIKLNGVSREIELKPGANRIGRATENDIQVEDDSISSSHCEMVLSNDGQIFVRDFGSTNGTFLNGEPISEGYFRRGQTLRLGNVEVAYAMENATSAATARTGLRIAKTDSNAADDVVAATGDAPGNVPKIALRVVPVEPPKPLPPKIPELRQALFEDEYKTFFRRLPGTFLYPFKGNGVILLICGTVLFVLLDFAGSVFFFLAIAGLGYLFLYLQQIVQYSAQGEQDVPNWPGLDDWVDDLLVPAFLLIGAFVVSFGPAVAMWIFLDIDPSIKWILGVSLVLFGCFYLPMAVLAVSMYDSLFALNPLLIMPSILRIPLEYLVACFVLGAVLAVRLVSLFLLALIPIPIFPTVVGGFFSLYFLTVEMRILGVMYHSKREELNWNF